MSGSAREAVLARIRAANEGAGATPAGHSEAAGPSPAAAPPAAAPLSQPELVDLFAERVADYRAGVHRVPYGEIGACVERICAERAITDLLVPKGLEPAWLPGVVEILADSPARSARELDRVGGVLTASRLAIAFTGTIVFDGGPGQGRRAATLVPDLHICVVAAESVVYGLDEALAEVAPAAAAGNPITFTSGPSATSDIELTRVEGVHGPRTLEVIIAAS